MTDHAVLLDGPGTTPMEKARARLRAFRETSALLGEVAYILACEPGDIVTRGTELTDGWFLRQELLEGIAEALDSDVIDKSLEQGILNLRGTETALLEKLKLREQALKKAREDLSAIATALGVEPTREAILDGIQSLEAKALLTDA